MNRRWSLVSLAAPALLALAGCQNADMTNVGALGGAAFSQNITVPDFHSGLVSGTERVTIRLQKDSLVARRIIVHRARQLARPERVDARVTAVATGSTADTLTLGELGGLRILVTDSTRFRGEVDEDHEADTMGVNHDEGPDSVGDGDRMPIARATFIARLQLLLSAGRRPNIAATRPAPSSPQAPGDGTFVAGTIRLDDGDEAAEISMNVDSANFSDNATPPPLGWITVLDLKIEVRSTTRISSDLPPSEGAIEFGGTVKSVDTTAGTVTLADSTVLKVVAGSEIEGGSGDEDDHVPFANELKALADVQAALTAGKTVTAHGRGVLEASSPRTIVVIEIRFFAM